MALEYSAYVYGGFAIAGNLAMEEFTEFAEMGKVSRESIVPYIYPASFIFSVFVIDIG